MSRQQTPNILDDLLNGAHAPAYDLPAAIVAPAVELAAELRYDYASLGAAGASIRRHALAIKSAERRMAGITVEVGNHLIAIKEVIPHGHWEPWLREELGLTERTGQSMMQIARRFGAKAKSIALLPPTVLGLLASPSVPDAAIDAAIEAAAVSPVTVTAAKAIIAQHKATGKCRKCGRTLTDPAQAAQGIGACCAAKLARGADLEPATIAQTVADVVEVYGYAAQRPTADERCTELQAWRARLSSLRNDLEDWGRLTGRFTETLALAREVGRILEITQGELMAGQKGGRNDDDADQTRPRV